MPDVIETTAREGGEPDAPDPAPEPSTAVESVDPKDAAIAGVADAAMAMPGVPGRDEFLALAMQARMLSLSGAAPEPVRQSPYVAFHVAMVGRDLGISPSAALELIDVIKTKQGQYQLSLSPQLLNGQVRRLGLGEVVRGKVSPTSCTAIAVGPGGRDRRCRLQWPEHVHDCECDILGSYTFTWEDAQVAGLAGRNCQPGEHRRGSDGKCPCNSGYVKYPGRMLWWRASGYLVDDTFPEAGLGLYTAEELGAVVDEHGRAIDVGSVELPPGYEPAAVGPGASRSEPGAPADPDDLWELQARLLALPDEQQQAWRVQKAQQDRLKGIPTFMLPASAVRLAKSMVSGLERAAAKADPDFNPELAAEGVKLAAFGGLVETLTAWHGPGGEGDVPAPPAPEVGPQDAPGASGGSDTPSEGAAAPEAGAEPAIPGEQPDAVRDFLDAPVHSRPTGADADEARVNIEATVKKMSLAEVKTALAEAELPVSGGAPALRAALVGWLVTEHMRDQQEGHQQ